MCNDLSLDTHVLNMNTGQSFILLSVCAVGTLTSDMTQCRCIFVLLKTFVLECNSVCVVGWVAVREKRENERSR